MTPAGKALAAGVLAVAGLLVWSIGRLAGGDGPRGEIPPSLKAAAPDGTRAAFPPAAAEPDPEFGFLAPPPAVPAAANAGLPELETRDASVRKLLADCDAAAAREADLVRAWEGYNTLLGMGLSAYDARVVKARINLVTDRLLFAGARADRLDVLFASHTVRSGERLTRIAAQHKIPWELIVRMNGIDPARMRAGQTLRVLSGPLTVVVYKGIYELDVLLDGKVLRAYAAGHGKNNCTPVGKWVVRSKMKNPQYTHPHTGERFPGGDPKNPVGTRYLALEGTDETTRPLTGYAIHGTIEPDSIGTQSSLGCVRLGREDIEELYDLLTPGATTVEIRP
jgi:hypothetical protein